MLEKLLTVLTPAERRRGLVVLAMMSVLAILQAGGVASVMPFLAVLGNPELVESNAALRWLYEHGGFTTVDGLLLALGMASFLLVIFSALFRIATTYVSNRYIQMRRYSISVRLLRAYLRQPYEFFLGRNPADLSKSVFVEADAVALQVIKPIMDLIANGLVAFVILALIVAVDPFLAGVITAVVGGLYGAVYFLVRTPLRTMGTDRVRGNRERFKAASEAFGGIKDLKLLGREGVYLRRYRRVAARIARFWYLQATLSAAPRYLIEAVGFGGVIALAMVLMATRGDLGEVLPLLGLYAFGAYRLLPAAQTGYASASVLRFGEPALDEVYQDLFQEPPSIDESVSSDGGCDLTRSIRFENVSFRYPGADVEALEAIDLTIEAGSTVGFVGATGAGKTTAIDLLLGLLEPTDGRILIDGRSMESVGVRVWQRSLGYVPQNIYLADLSIAQNIAFGVDSDGIDQDAVERAAKIARIHDFVVGLPSGYETEVGDRGVRISGGQRQRIGIARALYHNPSVLVFDEATSALDNATERAVMDAVHRLAGEKTIIMIAHRISTVRPCDEIFVLEGGRLGGIGTYEELKGSNPIFQRLAVA